MYKNYKTRNINYKGVELKAIKYKDLFNYEILIPNQSILAETELDGYTRLRFHNMKSPSLFEEYNGIYSTLNKDEALDILKRISAGCVFVDIFIKDNKIYNVEYYYESMLFGVKKRLVYMNLIDEDYPTYDFILSERY